MPTFYNFRENGLDYSFDDIFVPADLFRGGNLFSWGSGTSGEHGNANIINVSTPVTTFAGGTNWKQVSGGNQTAAIKTDGTLWTWGFGVSGVLGNALNDNRSTPVTTFAGGTDWKQTSVGSTFTAAIKTDGTLWTWGQRTDGRLGNGIILFGNISTPITTFAGGTNWKTVSSSSNGTHTVAIKTDGTLWVWGNGGAGQLGNASTTTINSTPVTTFAGGTNWKQVSAGANHTVAIQTDGTLWIWGSGSSGQLGVNDTTNRSTPITTFAGGIDWKQVSAGSNHTAAIKTDGTLWGWGLASSGQLGINASSGSRSTPVTTFAGGTDWKQVSCGASQTVAIKTDGTLWVWGSNSFVELGINNSISVATPVTTFAGGTNWKQVNTQVFRSSAVTYDDPVL